MTAKSKTVTEFSGEPEITEEQRLQKCSEAISQALLTYGCELKVFPQFTTEGRIVATAQLALKST